MVLSTLKHLNTVPNDKDTVVAVDELSIPYRALVLSNVSTTEVELLDLDSGDIRKTVLQQLYESNRFVNHLPVHNVEGHILDMNVSGIKDQTCVLDQSDFFRIEERGFRTLFEDIYRVKLIDETSNESLATILLDYHDRMVAVKHDNGLKLKTREDEDRKKSELVVFTISDLKKTALPAGVSGVRLPILDHGALAQGLLPVCEMKEDNITRYTSLTD